MEWNMSEKMLVSKGYYQLRAGVGWDRCINGDYLKGVVFQLDDR